MSWDEVTSTLATSIFLLVEMASNLLAMASNLVASSPSLEAHVRLLDDEGTLFLLVVHINSR